MIVRDSVAVVTVNWNGWGNTLKCLDALRLGRGASWRLIIVDNGSTDDSLAHLRDLGPDVVLIETGVNGGWTGGNNIGVQHALDAGFEHIFILNNDAFVKEDCLAQLLATRGSVGPGPVLGPIHRGLDAAGDFFGSLIDLKTGVPWTTLSEAQTINAGQLIETAHIKGAGIFAHRRHFETLGLFDNRFFLNSDDTDWCRRAVAAGHRLLLVRAAEILHVGSASLGDFDSPLQTYFLTRNRLLFAETHSTPAQRLRLWRRLAWQARALTGQDAVSAWLPRIWRARDGSAAAFRLGVRDYVRRRFGDCPPEVRVWHANRPRDLADATS